MTIGLQVDLPDEFAPLLGSDPSAAVREALLLQAVHEGRISVAYAGQLLGMGRMDAIRWYTSHGYPFPDMSPADLQRGLETLDKALGD
ncbi:MAG: UPF0175 family protein [Chloroflexi bacterium]|nr:UPF0175 family protein [Chloroflexota bacterium]